MLINLPKNKKYLLACSYGPDSMALFHMLLKEHYDFAVAHVNYNMRGLASELAAINLKNYAQQHNIKHFELSVEGVEIAGNFQANARYIRYSFFNKIASKHNFDTVLTAHHQDDHIETYLMQKRSRKKLFYYGIEEEITYNNTIVKRPLIMVSKKVILDYVNKYNVPHELDYSNFEKIYSRNKMRLEVVEKLAKVDRKALLKQIDVLNSALKEQKDGLMKMIEHSKVQINDYFLLNEDEKESLVYLLFSLANIHERFSRGTFTNINNSINKKTTSAMFKIYKEFYFVKAYSYFTIVNIMNYQNYEIVVKTPKTIKTMHFTVNLAAKAAIEKIPSTAYPLKITTATAGDTYKIKHYEKAISRLFIDMKMPRHLRLIWPIVKDKEDTIIYVPRYREDYKQSDRDIFIINT